MLRYCLVRRCLSSSNRPPPPSSLSPVVTTIPSTTTTSIDIVDVLGGAPVAALLRHVWSSPCMEVGMTGYGATDRVVNNTSHVDRPWEPSCVEVRNRKSFDEHNDEDAKLRHVAPNGRTRNVCIPKPSTAHSSSAANDDDPVEVVFYFETSTAKGLAGFQAIASRVLLGELPGECRNTTGQCGFATWVVPRLDFKQLVLPMLPHKATNEECTSPGEHVDGGGTIFLRLPPANSTE